MDAAFNFQTLDPDAILDALWETGLRVESGLTALNSYENRVYQFSDEDRHRYVVKFYRPQRWSAAQIEEEHSFTRDLQADEVPVAAPLILQGKRCIPMLASCLLCFPVLAVVSMKPTMMSIWSGSAGFSGAYTRPGASSALNTVPPWT